MMRVALFAAFATAVLAGYESTDDVVVLTTNSFDSEVVESADTWMVEFYAPWCGHCKQLEPTWKKAATAAAGSEIHFGAVDCTVEKDACQRYGIRGYPTIKIFGADKKNPTDYRGARTADSLLAAAKDAK